MTSDVSLRYPIGGPRLAESFTLEERRAAIEGIRQLPQNLRSAVAALSDEQLETPYRPGGWTVRQLVHHVADSHMNAYNRVRLALTEDWPTIFAYQEAAGLSSKTLARPTSRRRLICCMRSMSAGSGCSRLSTRRTGSAVICILRTAANRSSRRSLSMTGMAATTPPTSPNCQRAWAGSSAIGNPREV